MQREIAWHSGAASWHDGPMDGLGLPPGSPLQVVTAQERPDLWERARPAFGGIWPEYNLHGSNSGSYFSQLVPRWARFQVLVYDTAADLVVGRGRSIPFRWDGSLADLPAGIDAVGRRAVTCEEAPTAVSALAAEVESGHQRRGLSRLILMAMAEAARQAGLGPLVAPVRPSWKDRYPLIPIGTYAHWKRPDGLPFDPWMRVHSRLGAAILRPEPQSMQFHAPVADWEQWTGLELPGPGEYVFPGGLAPLTVADGTGRYWEPNVWMVHPTPA
jgi:GNAT superfamily N-acetyltransferase